MTHPAIKAALEALKNNSEAFAQIPDDAFGYIEDGTGDENGPYRWPIAREMESQTKKSLTALRALEGCVVIERGDVPDAIRYAKQTLNGIDAQTLFDGNREQLSPIEMSAIRASLKIAALVAAQMKGE